MESTRNETQTLLNLHCRMFALENLAAGYKENAKALKLCLKLVKIEKKQLNACNGVPSYDLGELQHRYDVLTDIIKRIAKSSGAANKSVEDLRILTENTQENISELREQLSPLSENVRKLSAAVDSAAFKLSQKLESGSQIISDKVSEAVDEIKKRFSSEEK